MISETKRPMSGNIAPNEDEDIDEPQEREVVEEVGQVEERPATEIMIREALKKIIYFPIPTTKEIGYIVCN